MKLDFEGGRTIDARDPRVALAAEGSLGTGWACFDIYQDLTMRTAAVKHRPSRIVLVPQHINCPLENCAASV